MQTCIKDNIDSAIQLVVGSTSTGVYPNTRYNVFIDLTGIDSFKTVTVNDTDVMFGATVTISTVIATLEAQVNPFSAAKLALSLC